ncbi:MAG TPA: hypothetical protein VMZ03_03845 [Chitinophagaceae bacterium]|nr:hypothetical protein [Chitinophagaceae bacterium]
MKKFFFLLLAVGIACSTMAQRATLFPLIAGDTISTSAALDTVTKVITATAGYATLGIQVNALKVSGTITAKAYLYSSQDGVTYNLTDSATAFANSAAAQSVWFNKIDPTYVYYKVQVRNVGTIASTEVLALRFYYVLHKHD